MYAQLCRRLCEEAPSPHKSAPCTFKNLLLSSCKAQFYNRSKQATDKRKSLGNIKFIGELCKLGIVDQGILHTCIKELLVKKEPDEMAEDLECLCQILRTCGHILDNEKARNLMHQYFERMQLYAQNLSLPIRIRFMLRDIIELREDKWIPRKAANTEGPLPINQICEDEGRGPCLRIIDRVPQQELFSRPLKTRSGLDNILSSGLSFSSHHDKFLPYNTNGFPTSGAGGGSVGPGSAGGYGRDRRQGAGGTHHHGGSAGNNSSHFFSSNTVGSSQQNRYNNGTGQHNNNNNSIGGTGSQSSNNVNKIAPRFIKRMMSVHDAATTNLDQVSLRPPANSMVFKPPNQIKPPPHLFSGRQPSSLLSPDSLNSTPSLNKPNPPPIQTSKEVAILIKPVSANTDNKKPNKKEKAATKEELLKKCGALCDDVLAGGNIDDALSNFTQLKVPDRLVPDCLHTMLTKAVHKKEEDRDCVMCLITALKKNSATTSTQFHDAFRNIIKNIPDLQTTVPNIYSIVAGFACTAIKEGYLSLWHVGELTEDGVHFPLLFDTLQLLNNSMDRQRLNELFTDSKINLMNSLGESERTKERLGAVLESRGLTFLEPVLLLEAELWSSLEREPTAHSLYKCAKESVSPQQHSTPAFITALVTCTLRYVTQESTVGKGITNETVHDKLLQEKEKGLLERFKSVLQAFLHADVNLQVTAVYALQVFCYALDFPKGMLLRWFVNLYDLEIIEEEAFLKWREDVTEIYPGKGKALFQVNQWLTWLAEAESEEEEEEEGDN
uniref:Eukaryotic translation initiation factor 4 gamma 2 n=1 Tax=Panstrongylus megistus TaxID=65343 RepID=A0A069DWX8_9HEMI